MTSLMALGERITGQFAQDTIEQSGLPNQATITQKLTVLDHACGSGVVTKQLLGKDLLEKDAQAKLEITCLDLADAMVGTTQNWVTKSGWNDVTVMKGDAMNTGLPSSTFDYILWNFGPFLLPRPLDGELVVPATRNLLTMDEGVKETLRMLKGGGTLGFTTWAQVAWFEE